MLHRMVYVSSSLHEELHHSMHAYMLVGPHSFVALNEYGPVLMLLVCALLFALLQVAAIPGRESRSNRRNSSSSSSSSVGTAAAVFARDMAPILLLVLFVCPALQASAGEGETAAGLYQVRPAAAAAGAAASLAFALGRLLGGDRGGGGSDAAEIEEAGGGALARRGGDDVGARVSRSLLQLQAR
jgi:hypothetical protein